MQLCPLYQTWITWRKDSQKPLFPWMRSHLASCPACREYLQRHGQVAQMLARSAEAERETASPCLHDRIMSAIDQAGRNAAPLPAWDGTGFGSRVKPWHSFRWIASCLAAAGLAVVILLWQSRPPTPTPVPDSPVARSQAPARPLDVALAAAEGLDLLRRSADLERPLNQEFQSCVADAQSAVAFLAANFLDPGSVPLMGEKSAGRFSHSRD